MTSKIKVLNLYAGIGGNRKLWGGNIEVTAVELDPKIAEVYKSLYPQDNVIVGDAHEYLEKNYDKFDFIWSSPPCPTHSQYRHNVGVLGKGFSPVIPDCKLFSEIIFLQTYCKNKFCIENVKPYYFAFLKPTTMLQRHLFWSNFKISDKKFEKDNIRTKNKIDDFTEAIIVKSSKIKNKRQVLRNCVNAELGLHIFEEFKKIKKG